MTALQQLFHPGVAAGLIALQSTPNVVDHRPGAMDEQLT